MIVYGLFIMCAVDMGLFWLARRLQVASHETSKGYCPLKWTFTATLVGFAVHIIGGLIAKSIMPDDHMISAHIMMWSVVTGLPAAVVMGVVLVDSCSGMFSNSLYMSSAAPSHSGGSTSSRK